MARHAVTWLERRALLARTVTIKVRYSDFTTVTRSHSAAATRDREISRHELCSCWKRRRRGSGPSGCLALASTISVRREQQTESADRLPFVDKWRTACTKSI